MLDFVIFVTFLMPVWGHPSPTQSCPTPPHPHTHTLHRPGTCYSIHLQDSFYVDAAKTCSSHGGSLATITTHSENQFITNKLKSIKNNNPETKSDQFWIGLNTFGGKEVEMKGQKVKLLTWEDESPMTYDNLQKDSGAVEKISPYLDHCVAMDWKTGTWLELACTAYGTLSWDRKNPFICEFLVEGEGTKFPTTFTQSPGIYSSVTVPATIVETTTENDDGVSSCPHAVCDLNSCNSLDFKLDSKGCFTCECNAATTTVSPNRFTTDDTTCPAIVCDRACGMTFVFQKDSKGCVTCECDTATITTTTTTTTTTNAPSTTCRTITCDCDCGKFVFTTDAKGCITCECDASAEATTIRTTAALTTSPCPSLVCDLGCGMDGFRIDSKTGCYLCECDVEATPTPPPAVASCPPIVVCHLDCPVRFVLDPVTGCGLCECDPDVTTIAATPTTTTAPACPPLECGWNCNFDGYDINPSTGCWTCKCFK